MGKLTKDIVFSDPQMDVLETSAQRVLMQSGVGCFTSETLINTITGLCKISNINIGDFVLSFNTIQKKAEFKEVIDKFIYNKDCLNQKLIIFTLNNGTIIKCTENHEFYKNGEYVRAIDIAGRIMEANRGNKLFCEQFRSLVNQKMERRASNKGYEAGIRCFRIFKNYNCFKWEKQYNKNAQVDSEKLDSKPFKQSNSKPYKWNKNRQSSFKFRVGNSIRKLFAFFSNWATVKCGGETPKQQIKRRKSIGNTENFKRSNRYGKIGFVMFKIWNYTFNGEGHNIPPKQGLEAREISLNEIASFEIVNTNELVYDLCVKDNHNYCITNDRIIVHNSGKSHVIGMIAFDFISFNPEVRGFIGANTYGQLTKSTLDRVFKVWEEVYHLKKNVHYVVDRIPPENFKVIGPSLKTYENTISFNNGGMIFLASLDNYKVIDGTEFGWALLDETKDTKEDAVKEVIVARLRQMGMMVGSNGKMYKTRKYNDETKGVDDLLASNLKSGKWVHDKKENKYFTGAGIELKGYTPLYVFTSPAKAKWLMNWFKLDEDAEEIEKSIYSKTDYYRKRKGEQLVVISSTYHNEPNLSPGYIERLLDDLSGNPGRIKMLIYGSPFGKTGGEYYSAYSRLAHVKKFDVWADEPVHLSFDFNVVPYMTCICFQMKFDPIAKRFLVRAFDEFCLPNPDNNTPALCRAVIKKYENLLQLGQLYYYGDYSGKARQTMSEEFKNQYSVIESFFKIYLNNYSDRVIPNMLHVTRRDFMNKLFTGGYPIDYEIHERCKELRGDYEFLKEDVNGGKLKTRITVEGVNFEEHGHCFVGETLITTIDGQKRIDKINIGDFVLTRKGYKKVLNVFDNGNRQVNTYKIGENLISCTPSHKFWTKEYGFKSVNDLIEPTTFCIFDSKIESWKEQKLSIMVENSLITQQINIIPAGLKWKELLKKLGFMFIFIYAKLEIYRKGTIYTMQTTIHSIIKPTICNVYHRKNILKYILQKNESKIECLSLKKRLGQKQLSGINQMQVGRGILSMLKVFYLILKLRVLNVEIKQLKKGLLIVKNNQCIAQINAGKELRQESLEQIRKPVYDIEVENEHEYFANNILVHNCSDASDYFFCSAFNNLVTLHK